MAKPMTALRIWRSHTILAAAGIGAIFGATNAVLLEIRGLRHLAMTGVLPFLFPSSASGTHIAQMSTLQVTLLLLIEVAGNVLGFALVFALPVAVVVGIRRVFTGRKRASEKSGLS
jgi:hypothetical protein